MTKLSSPRTFLAKGARVQVLSPLALLLLAACGGGGGSGPVSTGFTREGSVVKGPLKNALAFLDYDGDGSKDDNEPFVRTDADGGYSIEGTAGNENATLVAIADELTTDKYSGPVSGITLKAPATAKVVSIASTIYQEAVEEAEVAGTEAPTVNDVAKLLGIDTDALGDGVDLLDFNPDADATSAVSKYFE